jgi:hypothetical protein
MANMTDGTRHDGDATDQRYGNGASETLRRGQPARGGRSNADAARGFGPGAGRAAHRGYTPRSGSGKRPANPMSRAGSDLAQREPGWQASTSIDESIRAYVQWLVYDAEESQT